MRLLTLSNLPLLAESPAPVPSPAAIPTRTRPLCPPAWEKARVLRQAQVGPLEGRGPPALHRFKEPVPGLRAASPGPLPSLRLEGVGAHLLRALTSRSRGTQRGAGEPNAPRCYPRPHLVFSSVTPSLGAPGPPGGRQAERTMQAACPGNQRPSELTLAGGPQGRRRPAALSAHKVTSCPGPLGSQAP